MKPIAKVPTVTVTPTMVPVLSSSLSVSPVKYIISMHVLYVLVYQHMQYKLYRATLT